MTNPNCVNICLGNELLTEIDKYAKELNLSRADAMKTVIKFLKWRQTQSQPQYVSNWQIIVAACVDCGANLAESQLMEKWVNGKRHAPICQTCYYRPPAPDLSTGYNVSYHGIEYCVSCNKRFASPQEVMTKWINGKPISPLCKACFNNAKIVGVKKDPPWIKRSK